MSKKWVYIGAIALAVWYFSKRGTTTAASTSGA